LRVSVDLRTRDWATAVYVVVGVLETSINSGLQYQQSPGGDFGWLYEKVQGGGRLSARGTLVVVVVVFIDLFRCTAQRLRLKQPLRGLGFG
jgi:hypothetical protein